ncbi:glycosyltransferase family 2 protein [Peribacillus simplex]|uniref:Glycosyltransferase family 2 protein n=2 Tax=Peribacillus TaxID=2675229 RepID=A0AA90P728_9BACI|nr:MULTISPECIES: glycosyltransferase family 2 protein [Peribacillus]MDP1417453.1 glycosyltransferase family 2 protein [Peribacillus simplex]MDP1450108.1 glycosyltransferase family 2 protein [Peribacillus frigoritolerans]
MKLSIIIPVYNVGNHIKVTLESLLNQQEKNFEVIIVNDGSTDDSISLAKEIIDGSELSNFRIITKENGGVSSARNIGISEAMGEYILFLDADDYISHDLVHVLYQKLQLESPDIIYWGYDIVTEKKEIVNRYQYLKDSDFTSKGVEVLSGIIIGKKTSIWIGSIVFQKDLIKTNDIMYTNGCVAGEDIEFVYKALAKANNVLVINKVLSYYVQRQGSITNSYNIKRFDSVAALERVCIYFAEIRNQKLLELSRVIRNESIIKNYIGTFRLCMRQLVKSKRINPRKAIKIITHDIENNYPEMKNIVMKLVKFNKGRSLSQKIELKLFIISPLLYYIFGNIKNHSFLRKVDI